MGFDRRLNANQIVTEGWSNPTSEALYDRAWPDEPDVRAAARERGRQCGGCSFYAPFNADYGLCCHPKSRHRLETVFEHFSCPARADESWGAHSFDERVEFHCRCHGSPIPPSPDGRYRDRPISPKKKSGHRSRRKAK